MPTYGRGSLDGMYSNLRPPAAEGKPARATSAKDWASYDESHPVPDVPLPGEAPRGPAPHKPFPRTLAVPSALPPKVTSKPTRERRVDPDDEPVAVEARDEVDDELPEIAAPVVDPVPAVSVVPPERTRVVVSIAVKPGDAPSPLPPAPPQAGRTWSGKRDPAWSQASTAATQKSLEAKRQRLVAARDMWVATGRVGASPAGICDQAGCQHMVNPKGGQTACSRCRGTKNAPQRKANAPPEVKLCNAGGCGRPRVPRTRFCGTAECPIRTRPLTGICETPECGRPRRMWSRHCDAHLLEQERPRGPFAPTRPSPGEVAAAVESTRTARAAEEALPCACGHRRAPGSYWCERDACPDWSGEAPEKRAPPPAPNTPAIRAVPPPAAATPAQKPPGNIPEIFQGAAMPAPAFDPRRLSDEDLAAAVGEAARRSFLRSVGGGRG